MTALHLASAPPEPPAEIAGGRKRTRWPWALALLAAGGLAWFAWRSQRVDPLAGLELAEARRAEIEDSVTALGKLQPRDYVDVGAQVSGQLQRIAVQLGERVEAGALLAEIDPQLQIAKLELDRAQLAQLEAERVAQKLTVEHNTKQFERHTQMRLDGATRDEVVEQKRSDMRVAAARLDAIDAQIRQIRSTTKADEAQLGYTRIFAPMAGTVVSLDARPGQTLIASQQAPVLLRIADLASMTVWAQVSEADITRLRPGMDVYFTTLGHLGRKWNAKLRQVLPAPPKPAGAAAATGVTAATNNVVLYMALFDIDNEAGELRPEMSAQVFFVVAKAENAVLIPVSALAVDTSPAVTGNASGRVRIVNAQGELESRVVKLGVRNRFDVQILEGLAAGERVVVRESKPAEAGAKP
jgi:membrane fusion protein, macrolide-specific efflux system